jgi:hypothetical protein
MLIGLMDGALRLLLLLSTLWGAVALWHQLSLPRPGRLLAIAFWLLAGAIWLLLAFQGARLGPLAGMGIQLAALLAWWQTIQPAKALDWAEDVARLATGTVEGDRLTLHHVRHFDWQTRDCAFPSWESRRYDLQRLGSVDLFVSRWGRPGIAHVLVSFGFTGGAANRLDVVPAGGEFVTFSVEVRRQKHERFSEIGGFFKQYELAVIAADERDAIRLRSNVRGERVTLYTVMLDAEDRRELLLTLVQAANRLEVEPRFYHTITANCTTLVFAMMQRIIGPRLPLDHRLLLSSLLPGYIHDHGGLVPGYSLAELQRLGDITQRARLADDAEDFSRRIRQGVPGWVANHDADSP